MYVENCDGAGKVVGDCIDGIVSKCVAAPKTKTKDKKVKKTKKKQKN